MENLQFIVIPYVDVIVVVAIVGFKIWLRRHTCAHCRRLGGTLMNLATDTRIRQRLWISRTGCWRKSVELCRDNIIVVTSHLSQPRRAAALYWSYYMTIHHAKVNASCMWQKPVVILQKPRAYTHAHTHTRNIKSVGYCLGQEN